MGTANDDGRLILSGFKTLLGLRLGGMLLSWICDDNYADRGTCAKRQKNQKI